MTFRQVVPWESDEQAQQIRKWRGELAWLRAHRYIGGSGYGPLSSWITSQQFDFLRALDSIGTSPTDGDLLQRVWGMIQSSPSWLRDLAQFIAVEREKVLVITREELAQWTDEQLGEAVKAGRTLSFVDEGWGVQYEVVWDASEQSYYERGRRVHFKGIVCLLLWGMTDKIELIAPSEIPG